VLFFHDEVDPYQLHNLSMDDYPEQKAYLLKELAQLLKNTDDPWYHEQLLSGLIPY
jgi:hypothetical protein